MTGQEIQDRFDALIEDFRVNGVGKELQVTLRDASNSASTYTLENSGGTVGGDLAAITSVITAMKPIADTYESEREPVQTALEAFNTQRATHQVLIDAAAAARQALNDALEADATYQTLKTTLDAARADVNYIDAVEAYRSFNVSENFGNLSDAKGKYVA